MLWSHQICFNTEGQWKETQQALRQAAGLFCRVPNTRYTFTFQRSLPPISAKALQFPLSSPRLYFAIYHFALPSGLASFSPHASIQACMNWMCALLLCLYPDDITFIPRMHSFSNYTEVLFYTSTIFFSSQKFSVGAAWSKNS